MKHLDKRYTATFLACCLFILSIGLNNAYSVFIVPLANTLHVGRGTITLASTITDLICSSLSPVLVLLLNRVKLRKLLFFSTLAYSIILLGIGLYPNIYVYYLLNIIKGFVMVLYGCNVIIIVLGNWFEKGRQTLTGIAMAFTGVGGAIFSQVFDYIMENMGLQITFIFFAIASLVLALPAIYYLKLTPEEMGLTLLKEDKEVTSKTKTIKSYDRPYKFTDPAFIGICATYFIMVFITNVSIHFPGYAETIGLAHAGASMISWMMIGSILFKTGMGVVSDKFGPKAGFPVSILLVMISFILILLAKSTWMLLLGSFIFGSIFSTLIILNPLIRYCFGDKQYPEVFSKVMVVSAISNMGGPLTGYLYDFTGTYVASLYAAIILCIIAMICYIATINITEKA